MTDELGTVVRSKEGRRTMNRDQPGQDVDGASGADATGHIDRQASSVFSSTIVKHLICWPLAQASKTKS